ncbi:MAG: hypothetical protein RLZZ283_250 [Candidatus Parcubacteria bacterium]|jgi:hypothetical protein
MNNDTSRVASGATKALAVVGFLAILVVGMWGSASLATGVPATLKSIAAAIVSITSIFVPASETIAVTASDYSPESGSPVTFSYTHDSRTVVGSYIFRYSCANGLIVTSTQNGAEEQIFCNVPFHFIPTGSSLVVTPVSKTDKFVDLEIFIDFVPNGASTPTVTGSTVVTVENTELTGSGGTLGGGTTVTPTPTVPTTPKPTKPSAGTPTTVVTPINTIPGSNPNGQVDLVGRIIEVGIVDNATGAFTASTTPVRRPQGGRVAIRFAIENAGTKTSPTFAFNAVLPTFPGHVYSSPNQVALNPGDRIEYTIGFDSFVDSTTGEFILNIDPTSSINEKNKDNNLVKYTIYVIK